MRLLLLSGLVDTSDLDRQISENEKAVEILKETATVLVQMGWAPTLAELETLLPCERAALLHARDRAAGAAEVRAAVARSGPVGLAVASGDPEARTDIALAAGLAAAAQRARGMEPTQ